MKAGLAVSLALAAGAANAEPCFEIENARFCASDSLEYRETDKQPDFHWNHFEDDLFSVNVSVLTGEFHNSANGSHAENEIVFLKAERTGYVSHEINGIAVNESNLARSDGMNYYFIEIVDFEATLLIEITDFTEEFPDATQFGTFPKFVSEMRGLISVAGMNLATESDAGGFKN